MSAAARLDALCNAPHNMADVLFAPLPAGAAAWCHHDARADSDRSPRSDNDSAFVVHGVDLDTWEGVSGALLADSAPRAWSARASATSSAFGSSAPVSPRGVKRGVAELFEDLDDAACASLTLSEMLARPTPLPPPREQSPSTTAAAALSYAALALTAINDPSVRAVLRAFLDSFSALHDELDVLREQVLAEQQQQQQQLALCAPPPSPPPQMGIVPPVPRVLPPLPPPPAEQREEHREEPAQEPSRPPSPIYPTDSEHEPDDVMDAQFGAGGGGELAEPEAEPIAAPAELNYAAVHRCDLLASALAFIAQCGDFAHLPVDAVTGEFAWPDAVRAPTFHEAGYEYRAVCLQLLINLMQAADPTLERTTDLTLDQLAAAFAMLERATAVKWVPHTLALRKISTASVKIVVVECASLTAAIRVAVERCGAAWSALLSREHISGAHRNQINYNAPGSVYDPERPVARLPELRYLYEPSDVDYGRPVDANGWLVHVSGARNKPHNKRCTVVLDRRTRLPSAARDAQPDNIYQIMTKACGSGKYAPTIVI